MKFRNTIILAVLLVVLGGAAYYFQNRNAGQPPAGTTPTPTTVAVANFITDNASQFQLTDLAKNQTVLVARQGDAWHMQQPKDSATDPLRISTGLTSLADLQATRVLTQVNDLSAFGLVTGTIEARVTMSDTTTLDLKFGNDTIDQASTYMLKNGDPSHVYLVESSILPTLKDLIDNPPFPPTVTPTPLPTLTPTATPTHTPTPGPGTPSVTPVASPTP